ncbi:MAG TPA: SRPBCC family protein [Candidatus Limnocylindrales bacterium]|nr:SRPBCC family protein [Candidatus Limnocylindrales bacterium]
MIDIIKEIEAAQREVGEGRIAAGEGRAVRLRRTYDAPIEDVWDAVTKPDRISRWFLPISGDVRLGGSYQLEGNAGGTVLACEPPRRFRVTWVYGEPASDRDISEVEVRLSSAGEARTTLELEHSAIVPDDRWDEYGPGAVGVGWDGALLGLTLHLAGGSVDDPIAWQISDEGREFFTKSSVAWGEANAAAGADAEAVARAVANTTAFYAPGPETA